MSGRISREDVAHVARLARLALSEEELDRLRSELEGVLSHAEEVAALDTRDVVPTAHPLPLQNVLRRDEPLPCLSPEEFNVGAPAWEQGRFRVPRVLGEEP